LVEKHKEAIYADFRSVYGVSFNEVGVTVSWLEAMLLTNALSRDPSTRLCASIQGWKSPVSQLWILMAELYDLTWRMKTKKGKPYPRPWKKKASEKVGAISMSREQVIKILDRMNPKVREDGKV
jgi:hypothetical protein